MKTKFKDYFEFALVTENFVIDSFSGTLKEGFNRMHEEGLKQGKDVDLYYKNPNCYRYEKLSSTEFYRGKNERESNSACSS